MITSFNGKDTKTFYGGVYPQKLLAIRGPLAPNLTLVDVAKIIEFLKSPSGNRLEKLTGGEARPVDMNVNALARKLPVLSTRRHKIVRERCSITSYTAMRLARYFGGDAQS